MITPSLDQQRSFFEAFGFLKLPGFAKEEIDQITTAFESVFENSGVQHRKVSQTSIVPFIDRLPTLCALLDRDDLASAISNLIGPDYNYMGSDGNYYTGETTWHRDGFTVSNSFIKVAFYLDHVTPDSGCLRVIPGSHKDAALKGWQDDVLRDSENAWGLPQSALPAVPVESMPGDVLIFNHRLLHASFGGSNARRMFTMNFSRHAQSQQEIDDLIEYGDIQFCRNELQQPYEPPLLEGASEQRMRHLTQFPKYWQASVDRHEKRTAKSGGTF